MGHQSPWSFRIPLGQSIGRENYSHQNESVRCTDDVSMETNVTSKKLPNVYKSCPKIISLEKNKDNTFKKFPKNVGDLSNLFVAKDWKVAKSSVNRLIWSHWWILIILFISYIGWGQCGQVGRFLGFSEKHNFLHRNCCRFILGIFWKK